MIAQLQLSRIRLKRSLKRVAGWTAALASRCSAKRVPSSACIFVYHRVASVGFIDPDVDDWNVPPDQFERQIAALAKKVEFVSLLDLPQKLSGGSRTSKPLVCLTFDDGYANFHTQALPILKRYRVPATVFVVTSLIGRNDPMPFDSWSRRHQNRISSEAWRPLNWPELEACFSSGLISVGSHSHTHVNGLECPPAQLSDEARQSRSILLNRLGRDAARVYAYPYGSRRLGQVPGAYVAAVREAGYEMAVTTDLGLAVKTCDLHELPRIEAHPCDSGNALIGKACGFLAGCHLTDRLRQAKRLQP